MISINTTIIALVIIILFGVNAKESTADTLDINIGSYHSDRTFDYNEVNIGGGYKKTLSNHWLFTVGGYNNSFNELSLYAGFGLRDRIDQISYGIDLLILTGYDDIEKYETENTKLSNLKEFQPAIVGVITYHIDNKHALNISVLPATPDGSEKHSSPIKVYGLSYSYTL